MPKRGRKSQADLSVVPIGQRPPPDPPSDLTPEQKALWHEITARMPPDWFDAPSQPLLAAYVRHVCRARHLARALDDAPHDALHDDAKLAHFDKLSRAAERETRAALTLARSLRLTQQSRYDPRAAHRAAGRAPASAVKPWEEA